MEHAAVRSFPRSALFGAAAMIAAALAVVAMAPVGQPTAQSQVGPAETVRDLHFVDRTDGGVSVVAAPDGAPVGALEPNGDHFARGVLRGLVRERRGAGIGPEAPFRLGRHADGRMTITDLATGRLVALDAFGQANAQAFERFLPETSQK